MSVLNLSGKSTQIPTSIISEINQTIDASVSINDPVFFDNISSTWKKSDSTTIVPQGVFQGSGTVILRGLLTTTGLTPGSFYFMDSLGGLSIVAGDIFIGYAKSATELLVDIDIDPANIMNAANIVTGIGFWLGGMSASGTLLSSIDKIIFVTENMSTITEQIPLSAGSINASSGAVSRSSRTGYIVGSNDPSINKLRYDVEILSTLSSILLGSSFGIVGFVTAEVNNAGYLENKNDTTGAALTKLDFTSELVSALIAVTTRTADNTLSEPFNSTTKGYWADGGFFSSTATSGIGSILYSNESSVVVSTSLPIPTRGIMQGSDDSLGNNSAGYLSVGRGAAVTSTNNIVKFTFSNDVVTNLGTQMIDNRNSASAVKNSTDAFWNSGGINLTSMTKFTFATELGIIPASLITPTVQTWAAGLND